jgi:protein-tyrosine phosphatase
MTDRTHRVLFVCMGNICRSPTAEGVLRTLAAREAPALRLEVDSAGTHGWHVGAPPDPRSVAAAARRGYDISGLRARQVEPADLERFDLVLAMDQANLLRLERWRSARMRAELGLFLDHAGGAVREVPDPYHGDAVMFETVLDLCEQAARGLLAGLTRR